MQGAFVILIAMVVIGVILYAIDVFYYRKRQSQEPKGVGNAPEGAVTETQSSEDEGAGDKAPGSDADGVCCGMHTVCEKTNLSPVTGEIVYYDDEELDRFRGRDAESYTAEEVEEFRDVLLTLLPEDVAGWSRSMQVREICLPTEVRDELLLIVAELRK